MSKNMVDVIIHLHEDTSHAEREALRDELLARKGVMSADYHDNRPHLFLVVYGPDVVSSKDLLEVAGKLRTRCTDRGPAPRRAGTSTGYWRRPAGGSAAHTGHRTSERTGVVMSMTTTSAWRLVSSPTARRSRHTALVNLAPR